MNMKVLFFFWGGGKIRVISAQNILPDFAPLADDFFILARRHHVE